MIQFLRIQNLALLEQAELEFGPGFLCVTGETGAGKSVLLGALSLLAGARADKGLIREGAETCTLEAGLWIELSERVDSFLEQAGLPPCEEGCLLLRRALSRKRVPQVQVNGASTTVAVLRELAELWIDFHGPGEPQKLFQEKIQLAWLDAYCVGSDAQDEQGSVFQDYQTNFKAWKDVHARMDRLRGEEQLSVDEQDFLKKELIALESMELSETAIQDLERDYQRASGGQELVELANQIHEGLSGEDGVDAPLGECLRLAQQLRELDEEGGGLADRLQSVILDVNDISECFRDLADSVDLDPETVEEIESRMNTWMTLRRKYGNNVEAVLKEKARLEEKLSLQGDIEGALTKLDEEANVIDKHLKRLAGKIRKIRESGSGDLAAEVVQMLTRLGFKRPRFRIELTNTESFTSAGGSVCSFLFAPNAGQSLMPLNKIASSGETARVMLALKTLLARVDHTPVLVFDEVDANVGGEIGLAVGQEMRRLAAGHQVVCVTHLPQVAAQGHTHFTVTKDQDEASTWVSIQAIHADTSARQGELARMLGDRNSSSALEHAVELLKAAEDD